jgi:hypothetical protein
MSTQRCVKGTNNEGFKTYIKEIVNASTNDEEQ